MQLKDPRIETIEGIKARIDIRVAAIGIIADFHVTFRATFMCVRCLEQYTTRYETGLLLNYVSGTDPHGATENVDLTQSDVDKIYYIGPCIDLKIGIREAIILSLPIAPLCKEGCAGLCPVCGVNKNHTTCSCVIEKPGLFTPANVNGVDVKNDTKAKEKDAS